MLQTSAYLYPQSIIFLQADGIAGNPADTTHTGWIPVLSVSRTSGKTFKVTKQVDKSSPKFREYCANGRHLREVILDYPSGERYTLRQVIVAALSAAATGEELTLDCESFSTGQWHAAKPAAAAAAVQHGSAYLNPGSITFLQADGIAGNATDTAHTGWMPILSATRSVKNVRVIRRPDTWSPKLREYCATGRHIREAIVDFPSGERFALRDVIIGSMSGGPTTEEMTLSCGSIAVTQYRAASAASAPSTVLRRPT